MQAMTMEQYAFALIQAAQSLIDRQPIREDHTITQKLKGIEIQSYFSHATPAYMTVDWVGAGSLATGATCSDSPEIYTTVRCDSATETSLYFVRQSLNSKTEMTGFTLRVNSAALGNEVVVPNSGIMTLDCRESKTLVTDYIFGTSKLIFSTAEILIWQTIDEVP